MKKIAFIFLTCLLVVNIYSQTGIDKKNTIGAHVSRSQGNFADYGLSGTTFGVGIDYSRKLSERWSVCSGFKRFVANVRENYDFISIAMPVEFKRHYNIFFINFGSYLEALQFRYKEHNAKYLMYWGVGCKFGIGLEPEFKNGITLSLNPYVSLGSGNPQIGVSLGMGYKF